MVCNNIFNSIRIIMPEELKALVESIESWIKEERNHIFKYTSPLINPNSSYAKTVYYEYDKATNNARYQNYNVVHHIPPYGDQPKTIEVQTIYDFLVSKLRYHSHKSRKEYAISRIENSFKNYNEDEDFECVIAPYEFIGETDHEIFRAWTMFEQLFDISDQIAKIIESKNLITIPSYLRLIDENIGFLMKDQKSFFQLKMDRDELYCWLLVQIKEFKHQVEERDLWDCLKNDKEKNFQKIFDAFLRRVCELYDVDISPEPSTGGGIVDFKFSQGNQSKVCVELKLSQNHKVLSGLDLQLESYKNSEKTDKGIFVVLDSGKPSSSYKKLIDKIEKARSSRLMTDHIILINATGKPTPSTL